MICPKWDVWQYLENFLVVKNWVGESFSGSREVRCAAERSIIQCIGNPLLQSIMWPIIAIVPSLRNPI